MAATIRVTADLAWSDPSIEGLDASGEEWYLNVARYRDFIREAAGIEPMNGISVSDCYRIGNRLQALIERHKRERDWEPALVEDYSDVESLEEFLWVARFFETCHECEDAGEMCHLKDEYDDVCVSTD